MKITIDTNVLFQALSNNTGSSFHILQLIRSGRLQIAISQPVFTEYEDVLTRPKSMAYFELSRNDIKKFLRYIAFIAEKVDPRFLFRPNLQDEADNMFIELALASQSKFIITNNIKDFISGDLIFDDFKLITPSEFLFFWRGFND